MESSARPGILHVTMQPHSSLELAQFHDWYNNEHGPWRLRYPFFSNGFRYRATDLADSASIDGGSIPSTKSVDTGLKDLAEWMALYDVTDMAEMQKAPYTDLRKQPMQSQREMDTMKQIDVDRRFYDLVDVSQNSTFTPLEKVDMDGEGNTMLAISLVLTSGKKDDWSKWYQEAHLPLIKGLPGWKRTRHFETATVDSRPVHEILLLHEFEPSFDFPSKTEFGNMVASSWGTTSGLATQTQIRTYKLYYTFGPAPRELDALSTNSYRQTHKHAPHRTFTIPSSVSMTGLPIVESYITTSDGTVLPYTLTGSAQQSAPVIVLSNSILTLPGIWTQFLTEFFAHEQNTAYRVLTYVSREQNDNFCKTTAVTADVLADDVVQLLDALRIKKAKAIVGVSLGGVTALCCGLRQSARFDAFVACDTMSKNLPGADQVWQERIAVCESEGAVDALSREKIVGVQMAEATTRRWFAPESYDGNDMEENLKGVRDMVTSTSLDGFKASVQALWNYDFTQDVENMNSKSTSERIKSMFLVGLKDGVLPPTMQKMADALEGSDFVGIQDAGHLPMVEQPKATADAVSAFLAKV